IELIYQVAGDYSAIPSPRQGCARQRPGPPWQECPRSKIKETIMLQRPATLVLSALSLSPPAPVVLSALALSGALVCALARAADAPVIGLITKTETNPFFVKMKEGAVA